MKTKNSLFLILFLFAFIFGSFVLLFLLTKQSPVRAEYGLEYAEKIQGISKGTVPQYVGGIINTVIGILGVILVALIIYGGVLYMTAAGSEERTKTAKGVLTYAIIGIVIVFASYIIAKFVLQAVGTEETAEEVPAGQLPSDIYAKARFTCLPTKGGTEAIIYDLSDPVHKEKTEGELITQAKTTCQTVYGGSLKEEVPFYQN